MELNFGHHNQHFAHFFTDSAEGLMALTDEELKLTANFSEKRLRDFCTGRFCAHQALAKIDICNVDILVGSMKEPLWPDGIAGSISHSPKLTGAVVGRFSQLKAIGIDIETAGGVHKDLWNMLFTVNELRYLDNCMPDMVLYAATLLFSMKESFYKMQYPLTKSFLEFKDVEISVKDDTYNLKVLALISGRNLLPATIPMYFIDYKDELVTFCYL